MQIKRITKYLVGQLLVATTIAVYILSANSCANPGVGPTGGDRDTIPPIIISSSPQHLQTNFEGNEIILGFNEYIVAENLAANLVVSPPIAERPTVRIRGRNLIVRFDEDLIPGRTYSVDFQNEIKDFNEGNELEGLRMLFSTYDEIDTLRISGYLLDAFTLEPVKNAIATLYTFDQDTAFTSLRPDFIARADSEGFFMFDNLPEENFRLFGLVDSDRKLFFSKDNEKIAFTDSLIKPNATFIAQPDTLITDTDTLISTGHTQFYPEPLSLLVFEHKYYSQALTYSRRERADFMIFTFREPLTDSCNISIIDHNIETWGYKEYNKKRDSLSVWITDTLLAKTDTLFFSLNYTKTDSLDNYFTKTDTLLMAYAPRAATGRSRVREEESEVDKPKLFDLQSNLASGQFDLFKSLEIVAPAPLELFDTDAVNLEIAVTDSTYEAISFSVGFADDSKRRIIVDFDMKQKTAYRITVDSASMQSYNGYFNNEFKRSFQTQDSEYYGVIALDISGIDTTQIVQLLKNNQEEELVKEIFLKPGENLAKFDFLSPGKYRVKTFVDYNQNGKWDTGNFKKYIQPEPVYYFPKIFEVKSNWEMKEMWDIKPGEFIPKQFEEQ